MPPIQEPQRSGTTLVVIALSLAIVTALINYVYIQRIRAQVEADSFPVYRLTRDVNLGDRLRESDVESTLVPSKFSATFETAIRTRDQLRTQIEGTNNRFRRAASRGDWLMFKHFTTPEDGGMGEGFRPSPGMVATVLPVNSEYQPSNLRPNTRVDIEAAFPTDGMLPKVYTVLENVVVRGVGDFTAEEIETLTAEGRRPRTGRYRKITLEVYPGDDTVLYEISLFAVEGFRLSVRSDSDDRNVKIHNPDPNSMINPQVRELIKKAQSSSPPVRG